MNHWTAYDRWEQQQMNPNPELTMIAIDPIDPDIEAANRARDEQLVHVANRLGVTPLPDGEIAHVTLVTSAGLRYSWLALVEAHIGTLA